MCRLVSCKGGEDSRSSSSLKMILLLSLLFMFTTTIVQCQDYKMVTLRRIFAETKKAIDKNSTEDMMEVLSAHYFTSVKENSIWYLAQKENTEMFGFNFEMDSLQFLEKLLLRLTAHYKHCLEEEIESVERAQCFTGISWMLKDSLKGVRWHTDPDMEVGEKAKWGALYNSVAAMSALLSLVAKDNIQSFTNPHERQDKLHRFEHVIFKMISDLQGSNPYDHDVVEFRLDQISPVTICDIKMHFWKDFEGDCETRWTNMAYDRAHKNQVKLRDDIPRKVESAGGVQAQELEGEAAIPQNRESSNTVDPRSIDAATGAIGGDLGPTLKKYKAFIMDVSKDKMVYEKYFHVDFSSRGSKLDEVTSEALERRGEEELEVKTDIMKYINGTYYPNMKLLRTTLELLK